jgi:hypothetical protein
MGFWLGPWQGEAPRQGFRGASTWLRFYDRSGQLILLEPEAERQLRQAEQRRRQEEQRLRQEEQRLREALIAKLKARGIVPDSL